MQTEMLPFVGPESMPRMAMAEVMEVMERREFWRSVREKKAG